MVSDVAQEQCVSQEARLTTAESPTPWWDNEIELLPEGLERATALRAVTLWEPWATLIGLREKKIETRSRPVRPGPILIHASRTWKPWQRELVRQPYFHAHLPQMYVPLHGVFVCRAVVEVCARVPWGWVPGDCVGGREVSAQERAFGDVHPGRWLWFLKNVVRVEPLPAKGRLLVWYYRGPAPADLVICK